tara:strand:- start:70 stop:264 length:195 start_codon:yes stop_codon:yes gene_type:complete
MLKKMVFASFLAASTLMAIPQPAVAGPGSCLNCWWEEERNEFGDIIGGHWVCPNDVICQDEVEP